MADSISQTRGQILSAAYRLLYREGFARVSMDSIADAAGLTKKTLYYHFDSKDDLVAAVLDHQHEYVLGQIQNWGDASAYTPAEFLTAIFVQLQSWASEPNWLGSGFTRLTMELADLPGHPARRAAHNHKAAVEDWLAGELTRLSAANPAELARQAMLLLEGCLSLILIHRDPSYAASAARAVLRLAGNPG